MTRLLHALLLAPLLLCGCTPLHGAPRAAAAAPVRFTDVTAAAHLDFRYENGARGRRYLPETMGSGCAFIDYDGDGWLDILLLNGRTLSGGRAPESTPTAHLYHNRRDGTFEDVTAGSGLDVPLYAMGCCVGDYDNDGRPDLYVTCAVGPGHLFRNLGGGRFRDVTARAGVANAGHWGTSCAWLDYDGDGLLDLFVCNYVRYSPERDRPCTEAGRRIYCRPTAYPPDSCVLYRNRGDGTFQDVSRAAGIAAFRGNALGVAAWDFDGDGRPDLVIASDLSPNLFFRNRGNGRFEEMGLNSGVALGEDGRPRAGMGIDVADVTGDGRASILISNFSSEPLSFFVEDRPLLFTDQTFRAGTGTSHLQLLGFGLFFFDADNDGFPDAFVANGHIEPEIARFGERSGYRQRSQLYRNLGDGTFQDLGAAAGAPFAVERVGRGAACGDFNNDGRLDVLVNNNDGAPSLLRNDSPPGNWLQLELQGSGAGGSNRSAIGARVRVTTGSHTQTQYVRSGSSYCSASMLRLHFGLGAADHADRVEITWPDRRMEVHTGLRAGRRITFTEGREQRSP